MATGEIISTNPTGDLIAFAADPLRLLALCIWREARGEEYPAKRGIACTIANRCQIAPAQGFKRDIAGNVLKPWAFSSFNANDPNFVKFPVETDLVWLDCLKAATDVSGDVTLGAVFYHDSRLGAAPKAWGSVEPTVRLGNLAFYKLT